MIYAYLIPNDILYSEDLTNLNPAPFFVDKITRLGLDIVDKNQDSNMRNYSKIFPLLRFFKNDGMSEYWDKDYWHSFDYTKIPNDSST